MPKPSFADTVATVTRLIRNVLPEVEPNLHRNPHCIYDSFSASAAYRFARRIGETTGEVTGTKAIEVGIADSTLDAMRAVAGRVWRPQIVITRQKWDARSKYLYEVWYVRPETVYQTICMRMTGGRLTRYGWKRQWDIAEGRYERQEWRYGNLVVFGPHWVLVCKYCGAEEPFELTLRSADLLSKGICFTCYHLLDVYSKLPRRDVVIVGGVHYAIGEEVSIADRYRGHGGRRFVVRFRDGREVTTTNLWCQGQIPEGLRAAFPDRFADNATIAEG